MKQEAPVCGERDREVSAWVAAQATNTCHTGRAIVVLTMAMAAWVTLKFRRIENAAIKFRRPHE